LLPIAKALPFLKVSVHGGVDRSVVGHHFPLKSGALHLEEAIGNKSENLLQPDDQTLWVQP
jgi:hypothetical protein